MIEYITLAFGFGLGFAGAVALYCMVGYLIYRICSWAKEEISWKWITWRAARNEQRESWEKQKADLIAHAEKAAGQ